MRSLIYLRVLAKARTEIDNVIYIKNKSEKKLQSYIARILINYKKFHNIKIYKANKLNDKIIKNILKLRNKNFLISLPHGQIIKNTNLLTKKNLIHFHPGELPYFRGATSIYYSILKKNEIVCSCIILSRKIDQGKILFQKKFDFPKIKKDIDYKYDLLVRKKCLQFFLKKFIKLKPKPQKKIKELNYFIAHPVIRMLAYNKILVKNSS